MRSDSSGTSSVAVIGGGAIGLMTAYQLSADGADVTVFDARDTGRGAAEVNAGWVCPSLSAPVPGPGMVGKSLKWMLHRDSPLYIRPSLRPDFLKFMFGMWRACNQPSQQGGFRAHLELARSTADAYQDYRADGLDFELSDKGLLLAYVDQRAFEDEQRNLDVAREFGRDPQVLVGDDVRVHEPLLSDAVRGGVFFPHEQYLDPVALMRSLHQRLVDRGVRLVEHCSVTGFRRRGERLTHVLTATEAHEFDDVVIAAGGWTPGLTRPLGYDVPIRPGKGYSIDTPPLSLRSSTDLSEAKVAVTPLGRNLRLAGTMEFGGLDEDLNQPRIDAILRAPATYFRDWQAPTGCTPKAGIRPMTPDGLPVIGRLGRFTNTYVCAGHAMMGITMGPASARAVADLVLHDRQPDFLAPFSPQRFTARARQRPLTSARTSNP